jgi:signal transduction histidine kinase
LAFDANSLQGQLARQHRPEAATASRIARFLDQAITETRQLSRGLFPIRLEAEGLFVALEELARTTRERFQIGCRLTSQKPVAVENRVVATHLYRIAQEAVTNAVKHSRARKVFIQLRARAGQLELSVEDDGVGLSAAKPNKRAGLGLHIMDYRARSIGGALRLAPGSRGGTAVSCCVPCPLR